MIIEGVAKLTTWQPELQNVIDTQTKTFKLNFTPKKARKLRQIIGGSKSRMPPGLTTWHLPREVLDSDTGVTTPEPAHLNI